MTSRKLNTLISSIALSAAAHSVGAAQYPETNPAPAEAPAPALASEYADEIKFDLGPSGAVTECLPYARGTVHVKSEGPVEVMDVEISGLPPETGFDFFVTQLANPPFGLSWYQGDIETDAYGTGHARFVGRFNEETFIVAPGAGPAPQPHGELDAAENPATLPVHTFHIGIWFNSPIDAGKAECPDFTTPFNGEHNAGVQVLNSASFPELAGPLSYLKP